jgi:hypothetical protein
MKVQVEDVTEPQQITLSIQITGSAAELRAWNARVQRIDGTCPFSIVKDDINREVKEALARTNA